MYFSNGIQVSVICTENIVIPCSNAKKSHNLQL